MKDRCFNSNSKAYPDYGGRGITVCRRWLKFENFLADMGERPEGRTIDRYPNQNGNYELSNCRWATRIEQARNMRSNRLITINGITHCVREWEDIAGLPHNVIAIRLWNGWGINSDLLRPKGRSLGESRPNAKLTAEAVRDIRNRVKTGERQSSVAAHYKINQSVVSRISRGEAWSVVN